MTFLTPTIGCLSPTPLKATTWEPKSMLTAVTSGIRSISAPRTRLPISSLSGHAGVVRSTVSRNHTAGCAHVADHAQLGEVLVELGVLDALERLDDIGFGDLGHAGV